MTDRRAELEKKKLKLQQLRELKEQRRKDNKFREPELISDLGLSSPIGSRTTGGTVLNNNINKINNNDDSISIPGVAGDNPLEDVEKILESIGIQTKSGSASLLSEANHMTNSNEFSSTISEQDVSSLSSSTTTTAAAAGSIPTKTSMHGAKQPLGLASFPPVLIAPKEPVTYEKQTQTTESSTSSTDGSTNNDRGDVVIRSTISNPYYVIHWDEGCDIDWDDEFQVLTYDDPGNEEDGDSGTLFPSGQNSHPIQHHHQQNSNKPSKSSLPTVEMVPPAQTPGDPHHSGQNHHPSHSLTSSIVNDPQVDPQTGKKKRVEYKEEERRHLMQTESFQKFLDRAVRITERALACTDSFDIFVDYTGQVECVDSEDKSRLRLSLNTTFQDERWTRSRTVTSFDWCSQFPELLVASYNQNEYAPNEPDGICLVWNMKFKKSTPEYVFHCQSPVMSACFAKFHPNLILGGTYSGQIVLWDNRSGKRVPVQRSHLSASVHTHPVYCLKVVGTPNSHNLISISNDGKLCSWSLDMLSQPQETMELCQQKQSRPIAVTSMSFPLNDYNNFILGSQEGSIYSACRHGAKAGILDQFDGHQGPVTAVDFHQATSAQVDLSHLFITSSFDWTFKLWSMRDPKKLLYSFEDGSDYIYDIRWSPIHPALFATVDSLGKLDLWNLNQDTELPTLSTYVEGNPALNRLIWSPNGQQIVVGDDNGKVWVYDVSEQLAFPKSDEWTRFAHTLQEFTNQNVDI